MKRIPSIIRKLTCTLVLSFVSLLTLISQEDPSVEMADTMRSEGKIYVVVALLAAVYIGIAIYMLILERRVKKIEREFFK